MRNRETTSKELRSELKQRQLAEFQSRMPEDKQGVTVTLNGKEYVAAIRRLTPVECARLQSIPDTYDWSGVSESKIYFACGNGWEVEAIKHCFSYMPKFDRPIRVWSLFDGMACCAVVLKELGIPVEVYVSSEIEKSDLILEKNNFPDMVQVGSVTDINVAELVEKYGVPDLIAGGSPCQSFSMSGKRKGMATSEGEEVYTLERYLELKKQGFEFEGQSYLFWEYMRILTELRKYNPDIYFFLENVEMLEKWERCLSHAVGVRGVHINSALVSAQSRKRIYWTNFRTKDLGNATLFDMSDDPFEWPDVAVDIPQPDDRGIVIDDILDDIAGGKYFLRDGVVDRLMANTDEKKLLQYLKEPQFSVEELLEELKTNPKYADMTDAEKEDMARQAYLDEVKDLEEQFNGIPLFTDEMDEDEQEG